MKRMLGLLAFLVLTQVSLAQKKTDYSRWVNPFIGTGGHGHTYPGPTLPFGMVQLSPDTRLTGWDGCSGYHYSDSVVYGFSHTHLSGTGVADYGDILFMPTNGHTKEKPLWRDAIASRFAHNMEVGSPGFYGVRLSDYGIDARMTASTHAGMHEYKMQPGDSCLLFLETMVPYSHHTSPNFHVENIQSVFRPPSQQTYSCIRCIPPTEPSSLRLPSSQVVDGEVMVSESPESHHPYRPQPSRK